MATPFYTNDGLLASTRADWLQQVFNELTAFFDRVGLKTDVRKTTIMILQTFCSPMVH